VQLLLTGSKLEQGSGRSAEIKRRSFQPAAVRPFFQAGISGYDRCEAVVGIKDDNMRDPLGRGQIGDNSRRRTTFFGADAIETDECRVKFFPDQLL